MKEPLLISYSDYKWERAETPLKWQDDALCAQVGLEMFFPEKGGSVREAKSICAACDVREQCLAYALQQHIQYGIFGGLAPKERRGLARKEAA